MIRPKFTHIIVSATIALTISAIGFGGYQAYLYIEETQQEIASIKNNLSEIAEVERELGEKIDSLAQSNVLLQEALHNEQQRVRIFQETTESLTSDIDIFTKLSKLDPELLKKYSNVYFLSENYMPSSLSDIPGQYLYKKDEPEEIHKEVLPFLNDMLRDAQRDGVELSILSAHRSFDDQRELKNEFVVLYGAGTANSFSAEQGYSEHQLGTTVDFMTTGINGNLDRFGGTKAYEWLLKNAHKSGFVLSYPQDNPYYVFEPWHWRFVGIKLANHLRMDDINFYDMPQREIDEYLVNIFD